MGMYDDEGYDDYEPGTGRSNGGGLRKQLEEALAKNRELTSEVGKLRGQVTVTTLKDVLQKRSLKPGLAKWMAKDEVDPSDEKAVDAWLQENADTFDVNPVQVSDGQPSGPDDRAAEFAAFQGAQTNALPADNSKLASAAKLLDSATSDAEIQAALNAAIGR